jgi:hypothetical protein
MLISAILAYAFGALCLLAAIMLRRSLTQKQEECKSLYPELHNAVKQCTCYMLNDLIGSDERAFQLFLFLDCHSPEHEVRVGLWRNRLILGIVLVKHCLTLLLRLS